MLTRTDASRALALLFLVLTAACGRSVAATPDDEAGAPPLDAGPPGPIYPMSSALPPSLRDDSLADAALQRALSVAVGLPSLVAANVQLSRGMLVEAVYFATASSGAAALGQVTMSGTVVVGPTGTTYAPSPSDRMIVKLGGETHELVVHTVQGNSQADGAASWIASPHVLKYAHKVGERAEAQISVQFDGTRFEAKTKGWLKLGEQRYDVSLSATGGVQGDRGLDGHDITLQYDLTGDIRGGGSEIAVKERHVVQSAGAYSLRLLTTQRGTASLSRSRSSSVLKHGGATYELADVDVRWEGVDKGNQQRSGVTALAGAIARDGKPFATCALVSGVPCASADGKTIRLDDLPAK